MFPEELLDKYLGFMQRTAASLVDNDDDIAKPRCDFPRREAPASTERLSVKRLKEVGVMAGIEVPEDTKNLLLVKNQAWGPRDVLCRRSLPLITRYTTYQKFEDAVDRAIENLEVRGKRSSAF